MNNFHDLGDGEFDDAFGYGEVLVGSPERSVVWECVPLVRLDAYGGDGDSGCVFTAIAFVDSDAVNHGTHLFFYGIGFGGIFWGYLNVVVGRSVVAYLEALGDGLCVVEVAS